MILLLHIVIALASIAAASYALFFPSKKGLHFSYILVGLTTVSGVYMVIEQPVTLTQVCMTGLVYLSFVSIAIVVAKSKLAKLYLA